MRSNILLKVDVREIGR